MCMMISRTGAARALRCDASPVSWRPSVSLRVQYLTKLLFRVVLNLISAPLKRHSSSSEPNLSLRLLIPAVKLRPNHANIFPPTSFRTILPTIFNLQHLPVQHHHHRAPRNIGVPLSARAFMAGRLQANEEGSGRPREYLGLVVCVLGVNAPYGMFVDSTECLLSSRT